MVSDQMHPFYSIAKKMMVWIVFEQFKNLHIVKDSKICFGSECTISKYRCFCTKFMHSTLLDKKMMVWIVFERLKNLRNVKR
jgi:hypothetical protein